MDQYSEDLKLKQQAANQANDINLLNMIESRIMEIIQIEDECKRKLPKLYHQRLPRFMRRRAACHNPKRIPTKLRPTSKSEFGTKSRKSLLKYRRKIRFRKHKRILRKHANHKYNNPFKSLLHKWFAKRFKMGQEGALNYVPMHNSTKNQRNIYRATRYSCTYLSLAHLIPIYLTLDANYLTHQLEQLNKLTKEVSGFTFCARSLAQGNYEIVVHLYKLGTYPREYLCPALVNFHDSQLKENQKSRAYLTLWVARDRYQDVQNDLVTISNESDKEFTIAVKYPSEVTRIRLVGPKAHEEAFRISEDKVKLGDAIDEVKTKLDPAFGMTIGRCIKEKAAIFTFYYTKPTVLDIVFTGSEGRMLWYQLIKNKAHLAGGYRDISRLLTGDCFKLQPDDCIGDQN